MHPSPRHAHSDAPASLLWLAGQSTHTPADEENVPALHTVATSPPSHPKPEGHAAHTRSPLESHARTRRNPSRHSASHPLHSRAPRSDHVPGPHAALLPFAHWNPGSHGQQEVQFGGSRPYSPGGQEEGRRRQAVVRMV